MSIGPPDRLRVALADRYRIERELGAGGMATVYLAEDVRHRRKVAVKMLHPELSAVLGGERFLKEIELTASLQHPHILPLFDSGEAAGQLFYVMPFVEGETLRARLEREKQLPIADALRIAREVADALQYAHDRGVIHRDIKPENILLQAGHAQVADFGIALAVQQAGGTRMTQTGLSLGTPQYMAPEQAMGEKTVDARADVYALGAVVYEMLAGEPPFTGPTAQAIVARVLTAPPAPITQTRSTVPDHVEQAVLAALAKLPADRPATAAVFMRELSAVGPALTKAAGGSRAQTTAGRSRRLLMAAAALSTVAAFFVGQTIGNRGASPDVPTISSLVPEEGENWRIGQSRAGFALSPDGRRVAIRASVGEWTGLLVRSLDSVPSARITNTSGAIEPFWSPDGDSLGFFADGQLKVVELSSGSVRSLCPASNPEGASWGTSGLILYSPERGGAVHRTTVAGRECALLPLEHSPGGRVRPYWLSDDRRFVLVGIGGAWIGTPGESHLDTLVSQDATTQQPIVAGDFLLYTPQGAERRSFHAQRINVGVGRLAGPVVPVMSRLQGFGGRTALSASRSGSLLAAVEGAARSAMGRFTDGILRDSNKTIPDGFFERPRLTSDGRQLVCGGFRLSMLDLRRGVTNDLVPLRTPRSSTVYPLWAPGDTAVTFVRNDTVWNMSTRDRRERPVFVNTVRSRTVETTDWSPDGRYLAYMYTAGGDATIQEPWVFDVASGASRKLFKDDVPVRELRFSPDRRWVAYERIVPEGPTLYVRAFPDGVPVRVLPGTASAPRWGPRGASLFFRRGGRIEEVQLAPSGEGVGAPRVVVSAERIESLLPDYVDVLFDVASSTGEVLVWASGSRRQSLTLVQHWTAMMGAR